MLSIDEYKAIFDAAPDGVLVVAADGTIRAANPKIEQFFGWRADELEGEPMEVLLPDVLVSAVRRRRSGAAPGRSVPRPRCQPDITVSSDGELEPLAESIALRTASSSSAGSTGFCSVHPAPSASAMWS